MNISFYTLGRVDIPVKCVIKRTSVWELWRFINLYILGSIDNAAMCVIKHSMKQVARRYLNIYEGRSESKERSAIQRYLLIIRKKQNMQVLSHTFSYFSTSHLGHWGTCRTVTPVCLFPPRTRKPPSPTRTNFAVLQMFDDSFVNNCTRHFRTLFIHFANCEVSIISNDVVHLLLQCICDDRGSPRSLSIMNICLPIPKHSTPFLDTGRVHNMFAIDGNKSSLNFTGSNIFRLQKPNHASQSAGFDIGVFIVTTRYTHNVKSLLHQLHQVTIYTLLNTPHDWSGTMKQLHGLYGQTFFTFWTVLVRTCEHPNRCDVCYKTFSNGSNLKFHHYPTESSPLRFQYLIKYIQGVPGGLWNTSGECSLC